MTQMNDVTDWRGFVSKLSEAKKQKKNKGLSMSVISTLIYSGVFDSMATDIISSHKRITDAYDVMFNQAKSALKSTASKSKTKGSNIGLSDVTNDIQLTIWRFQVSPISEGDILDNFSEQLMFMGYEKNQGKWKKPGKDNEAPSFLTDHWSPIYDYAGTPLFKAICYGQRNLDVMGIVNEAKVLTYQGNKEMLKFKLFTGKEYAGDFVIWPDDTGKIKKYDKELITDGMIGIFTAKPSNRPGDKGGSVKKWKKIGNL